MKPIDEPIEFSVMRSFVLIFAFSCLFCWSEVCAFHPREVRSIGLSGDDDDKNVKAFTSDDWEKAKNYEEEETELSVEAIECNVNPPIVNATSNETQNTGVGLGNIFLDGEWKDATVPYEVDSSFTDKERLSIAKAIIKFHDNTCVRFVNRTNEKDYVYIRKDDSSCSSLVGRGGGRQDINLRTECAEKTGIVQHELMHALGFIHEHQRADRNRYVAIMYPNIVPLFITNFEVYPAIPVLQYDYGSVLHYPATAGSWNLLPTIVPLTGASIGQRKGMSKMDIKKIKKVYCGNGDWKELGTIIRDQMKVAQSTVSDVVKSVLRPFQFLGDWATHGLSCAMKLKLTC